MGQASTRLNYHRRRQLKRDYAQKIKTETPCADCGRFYHFCIMEFDHIRGEKRYAVSHLASSNLSLSYLIEEIEKCDVVCSNCHRLRTFARKVWMPREHQPERIRNTKPRSDTKGFDVSQLVTGSVPASQTERDESKSASRPRAAQTKGKEMAVDTTTLN